MAGYPLGYDYFDIETRLMLLLSRVELDPLAFEESQSALREGLDWNRFISLTTVHGTAPMVSRHLSKLRDVPPGVLGRFRNIHNNQLRSNILMVSELDRISNILTGQGIEVMTLKGAACSEAIFGDIGAYPSDDIDLLVRVKDIDRVRTALEADGYRLNDVGFDEYRDFFMKELYHISLSNGRFTVEPHWNLFTRYFNAPQEFWWRDSLVLYSGGKQYRSLSPEKYVLYTSFRLFSKGFGTLRFLIVISEIIRHYADVINWDVLFRYARGFKFENVLRVSLSLAENLFGAPVPEEYSRLTNMRSHILYPHAVRRMMSTQDSVHPLHKIMFAFLRDDLSGPLRVLLNRLFPDMGEIIARYRLTPGSGKVVWYWILNPFLLMMRRHQK